MINSIAHIERSLIFRRKFSSRNNLLQIPLRISLTKGDQIV